MPRTPTPQEVQAARALMEGFAMTLEPSQRKKFNAALATLGAERVSYYGMTIKVGISGKGSDTAPDVATALHDANGRMLRTIDHVDVQRDVKSIMITLRVSDVVEG